MPDDLELSCMRPDDLPQVVRTLALAFGGAPEGVAEWLSLAGHDSIRLLREGGRPVATLTRVPMGQYFGGRSVPMLGIAGVGVPPELRGRSFAKRLMQGCIRDAAREGWALSTLFASTHTLYRAAGYERAGHRFTCTAPSAHLPAFERAGRVVPLDDPSHDSVRALYAGWASAFNGMLDRGPYCWARVRKFREQLYQGFMTLDGAGKPDGYLFLSQARRPDGKFDLILSDVAFASPEAGRRLVGFLAGFGMMMNDLIFSGGATHPLLMLLPQQRARVELRDDWMLRVVDVEKALSARGYPPGVDAEVHMNVTDELVPANAGNWVLRVAGGRGKVSRGGSGDLQLSPNGLACLYSGYYTPTQAALAGLAQGPAEVLAGATGVFTAGSPWMTDFF